MDHVVVDAMNVIGARPDGWWRDRDGALRTLVVRLRRYAEARACTITVVADGRPLPDLPEGAHGPVELLYATRGGRNAADDRIAGYVRSHPEPRSLDVVTSDRDLASRVSTLGARVRGVQSLLAELDAADDARSL
jgi:predicted RNA-binding protein with PIN domain